MKIAVVTPRSLRGTGHAMRVTTMLQHYRDSGFAVDLYHYRFMHEKRPPDELLASPDTYVEHLMEHHRVRQHAALPPPLAWSVGREKPLRADSYDLVQAETSAVWSAARAIEARKHICVFHDDDAARLASLSRRDAPSLGSISTRLTSWKYAAWQQRVLSDCDEAWFVSDEDRARLSADTRAICRTVPNGAPDRYWSIPPSSTKDNVALFVGPASYAANRDGLRWFLQHAWASVREHVTGAELHVIGEGWDTHVAKAVCFRGFVPSLLPEYQAASVVIAPVLGGGGTKIKVVEAMAAGRPVVTTSAGAAGIPEADGLAVCDDPASFAAEVVAFLEDGRRRNDGGQANRRAVEHLRWSSIWREAVAHISAAVTSEGSRR